jgi:gliding motility-associated-like protein
MSRLRHFYIVTCLFFVGLQLEVEAKHIIGGEMYYEYLGKASDGKLRYKVTLKVYRDGADPTGAQLDGSIGMTLFNQTDNAYIENFTGIPLSRVDDIDYTLTDNCLGIQNLKYQIGYYTQTVELPESIDGYYLAYQRCCRKIGIANLLNSDDLGATYSTSIPGTRKLASAAQNSSSQFANRDSVIICQNSPFSFDFSATDPDNDSLVYYFSDGFNGGGKGGATFDNCTSTAPTPSCMPIFTPLTYNYSEHFFGESPMGASVTVNAKTGIVSGRSPAAGDYVVTVFCDEYRSGVKINTHYKEFLINVRNCVRPQALLAPKPATCDGFNVYFENESTSPRNSSYFWDFGVAGVSTDVSTDPTPTFTYPDTGVYIAKLIVNREETCSDTATRIVRVYPGFFPNFTYDSACVSSPFTFKDASTTKYGVINFQKWDFGDLAVLSDTSLLRNAPYRYPAVGNYQVQLEVASDKGCVDTVKKSILVFEKPALSVPFIDTLICTIDTLQLQAIASPNGSFSWSPTTNMLNGNTPTPLVWPKDTTTYTVTFKDVGCTATATVKVNTLDFITVDAGPDTTICRTDGVQLKPITHALGFLWTPESTLDNSRIKNPIASPVAASTTYTILANLGKCQASDNITIFTIPYPVANAGADTIICFADTATLRGKIIGNRFAWTPTNHVQNSQALTTKAFPLQTTPFVLTVYDNLGCPKPGFDTVIISVRPRIHVFAGNDTSVVLGQPVQLTSVSSATSHSWWPISGVSNPSTSAPVITLNSLPPGGSIKYILTGSTPDGCNASDDIVLKVFTTGPTIFVPTAFTPNSDGKNDYYKPVLAGMRQLIYFRIYNRYGSLIFETATVGKGWDGKVKGQLQNSGAYVYTCQAVNYIGNVVNQKGSFVLIR